MSIRHWTGAMAVAVALLAGCGGDDSDDTAANANVAVAVQEESPSTEAPLPDPTATPLVEAEPTATPPDCGDRCVTDEDRAAIDAVIVARNSGDWEVFTAALGTTEPSWETGHGQAQDVHIRADFEWGAALNEIWELGDCLEGNGFITCDLSVEDDFHRAVGAAQGVEPSQCRLTVAVDDTAVDIRKYEITTCFLSYDIVFHEYGDWHEQAYPDQETVHGFHYRGWNQFDEGAPQRAADHLTEFAADV